MSSRAFFKRRLYRVNIGIWLVLAVVVIGAIGLKIQRYYVAQWNANQQISLTKATDQTYLQSKYGIEVGMTRAQISAALGVRGIQEDSQVNTRTFIFEHADGTSIFVSFWGTEARTIFDEVEHERRIQLMSNLRLANSFNQPTVAPTSLAEQYLGRHAVIVENVIILLGVGVVIVFLSVVTGGQLLAYFSAQEKEK